MSFLTACNSAKKGDQVDSKDGLSKSVTYKFSHRTKEDTLKVELIGEKCDDMLFLFTIKSHEGNEIYRQEIKANTLLKNYVATAKMKSENEKIQFLKEEVEFFFNERHFLEPAVTENEQPDKNVPDLAFYQELKTSELNGFDYRLGKDNKIYIAWSEKEQQVKVYYQCCQSNKI